MSSPILEALPTIHITVIGVIAAFFSAFAIYTYQKVNDAKEKLDFALKQAIEFTSTGTIRYGQDKFVTGDGNLDWDDNGKVLIRRAALLYSYLEHEDKFNEFQREPSSEEVIATCNDLILLFDTIFSRYPFWSNRLMYIRQEHIKMCNRDFDLERIHEMQRIVAYTCRAWGNHRLSIVTLARKGIEFGKIRQKQIQTEMFNEQAKGVPEHLHESLFKNFDNPAIGSFADYETEFAFFFEKMLVIKQEVIPQLLEALTSFTTYNQTFKVKETTLKMIKLITLNLVLGVILPLIILNLFVGVELESFKFLFNAFEYFLLLITMVPYFLLSRQLFNKVKGWDLS